MGNDGFGFRIIHGESSGSLENRWRKYVALLRELFGPDYAKLRWRHVGHVNNG